MYTIGFKGRVSFRVYNTDKPQKWGIKVYAMADGKNGYITCMEPYFGKPTTDLLLYPELPVTARVVLTLADKLKHLSKGGVGYHYHIYVDRFYSSMVLTEKMKMNQMYITGTVMSNRQKLPPDVKKKIKMAPGELLGFNDNKNKNNRVTIWKDKRPVLMLSNYYDFSVTEVTRKAKQNGSWI